MANPGKIEVMCTSGSLYDENFVRTFGMSGPHWVNSTWFQREASLRHDMVSLLLCNLEISESRRELDLKDELAPPPLKRARVDSSEPSTSSSSSADRGTAAIEQPDDDDVLAELQGDEHIYRYILLEGRSNVAQLQAKISALAGIPVMTRQYDIFDKTENKFLEVKVTLNYPLALSEYYAYADDPSRTALIHINPETMIINMTGKRDRMPGEAKAIEFLLARQSYASGLNNYQESDLHTAADLAQTILNNARFNKCVEDWTKLFWEHRKKVIGNQDNFAKAKPTEYIVEHQLKEFIEDTSKRNAPFMTFPGKILPEPMVDYIETELTKDSEMIELLFQDLSVPGHEPKSTEVNWIVNKWKAGNKNTFSLFVEKDRKLAPKSVLKDLGIGCKTTIRNDNFEELRQPQFAPPEPARYSAWMSHLLYELAMPNRNGVNYFLDLQSQEMPTEHPMNKIVSGVADEYFQLVGKSTVGAYCSRLKNVYSRFGGAYLGETANGKGRVDSVVFPIYSVGVREGTTVRMISGFVVRGPQHARSATDKIPFISVELLNSKEGRKYREFIRNSHIFYDSLGRAWCYRVNSIMKCASSFISFCTNATYLPANMLGELTLSNPHNRMDYNADADMLSFIGIYGRWLMERCAESVMMAAIGGSHEEGAMAIIRKIFMLKLNWYRGKKALGCDTKGLAEALNENLINSPFALYLGQQIRMILN